jgi:hypothetical protein
VGATTRDLGVSRTLLRPANGGELKVNCQAVITDVPHASLPYNPRQTSPALSHSYSHTHIFVHCFSSVMRGFGIVRDSGPARLITSLLTAFLVTSATFLPFLIQRAIASPVAVALPQPEPAPQSGLQSTRDPPLDGYYPEPEQCRGNCSWIHDPSIYYENGTYWRFSTSGNIAIATAPSIGGPWRYEGALLHQGTSISVVKNQDIWVCLISAQLPSITSLNR